MFGFLCVNDLFMCIFSPKAIFIMGGGEGSTARELLRHNTVVKVIMCDIDEVTLSLSLTHKNLFNFYFTFD